jgi:hypothetical protein
MAKGQRLLHWQSGVLSRQWAVEKERVRCVREEVRCVREEVRARGEWPKAESKKRTAKSEQLMATTFA